MKQKIIILILLFLAVIVGSLVVFSIKKRKYWPLILVVLIFIGALIYFKIPQKLFRQPSGGQSPATSTSESIPSLGSGIPIGVQLDEPKSSELSDDDLKDLASKYDAISDRRVDFTPAQIKKLKEFNPSITVIRYVNFSSIFSTGGLSSKSDRQKLIQENPEMVLKDNSGENEPALWGGGSGVTMDPANTKWKEFLSSESYEIVNEKGYDGIMADVVLMANKLPNKFGGINPKTNKVYTTEEYRGAQYETLKAVKQKIGGKKLIANNIRFGKAYFEEGSSRFLEVTDGVVSEEFRGLTKMSLDQYFPEDDWEKDVEMLLDVQSKGKSIMAFVKYDKNTASDEKKLTEYNRFMLATYLLGKGDLSSFGIGILEGIGKGSDIYDPIFKTDIGKPIGNYSKKDGIYQREFEKAKVLVNPAEKDVQVKLDKTYKTIDGDLTSEINMKAHMGIILLK